MNVSDQKSATAEVRDTTESIKLLKDWSIWLVGIQTGAIAVIGTMLKDSFTANQELTFYIKFCGVGAVVCFITSIFFATFLLVSLPAFHMRHRRLQPNEDFVELAAFESTIQLFRPKLLTLIGGEQWAFLIGIVFFGVFAALRISLVKLS